MAGGLNIKKEVKDKDYDRGDGHAYRKSPEIFTGEVQRLKGH
jgi:hypothetical protein